MSHQSTALVIFLALLPVGAILVGCVQLFSHYLYDVRLGMDAVEFVLFKRFVTCTIPYGEITTFDKISLWQTAGWNLNLANRPLGPFVLLHRTRGFFRRVVVTPRNADEFCNALRNGRRLTEA
jgi:hypothetical protein